MSLLYEYYNINDTNQEAFDDVNWSGQTFTPSVPHKIQYVVLKLGQQVPEIITVSIRATVAGLPVGPDLCSGVIDGATLPVFPLVGWATILLGSGCNLMAGTTYAIVCRTALGGLIAWRVDEVGALYAGGQYMTSPDSGATWDIDPINDEDFMFEEWGVPVSASGKAYALKTRRGLNG